MRILSALGPESLSAAEAAIGWRMEFSSDEEILFIGEVRGSSSVGEAKILWSLSGNFVVGNDEEEEGKGGISVPVMAASSAPNPASSRAPRPRAVRMAARWPME